MGDPAGKLQAILDGQIGKGGVHNMVAAVQTRDRSVDFLGAAGVADPASGARMTPNSSYFIASVTKMFTAATVMRLHQEKRLDLDAPITRYLPPSLTRAIHVYEGTDYSDRIKVCQLLGQTSGLADYEMDKPKGGRSVFDRLKAGEDMALDADGSIEIVRGLTPHFPPGTPGKAYYSSANYCLLGAIIESVSGKSVAGCFKEGIADPLGLKRTYAYNWAAPLPDETPATIFWKGRPANAPKYLSSNLADGGLVSTAAEQIIFLRAFFEGRLFDGSLLDRMMAWNRLFFPLRYGYGLMDFRMPRFLVVGHATELIGHSGSTGSFAFACPERSLYLAGTLNEIDSPRKPFFLMMRLAAAAR